MNPHTGEIYHLTDEEIAELRMMTTDANQEGRLVSLKDKLVALTDEEATHLQTLDKGKRKGWMRNQPCPCGSNKKFKRCCWSKFK